MNIIKLNVGESRLDPCTILSLRKRLANQFRERAKRVGDLQACPTQDIKSDSSLLHFIFCSTDCTLHCCNQQHRDTTQSHRISSHSFSKDYSNNLESPVVVVASTMPTARRTRAMGLSPGGPKALDMNAPTRRSRRVKSPAGKYSPPCLAVSRHVLTFASYNRCSGTTG